jgi:hypothetical protein
MTVFGWLMYSTSHQTHIDDSIWMINVFNVTSSTHWWQIQILSSICAWGDVKYINHPNTVINVCLRWRRIHYSSKYCHQCVLEVASNTLIIQILSSMCVWCDVEYINHPNTVINMCLRWLGWLMHSTSPQAHIDDSIWMINVFDASSSTHWWQYLDD